VLLAVILSEAKDLLFAPGSQEPGIGMENAFELKPAEIPTPISFREGGRKFRVLHSFRPPQFADWLEYEMKLNRSVEIVGSQTRFDQERAEAAEAIWDRIALNVEGYLIQSRDRKGAGATGPAPMEAGSSDADLPEAHPSRANREAPESDLVTGHSSLVTFFPDAWRERVPLLHKMAAIQLLAQVFPSDGDETEAYHFDPEQIEVHLVAARGGREHSGLIHTLQRPSIRQQKEFSRVISTAFYVRGSRTEKSLLPSRLREMVRFYDQLVVGVRGYSVNGEPATREDAVKWMDALHKQTAISALFNFEDSGPEPAEVA
jgi:hypothetical protein